jgi:hypothetical protein
MSDNDHATSSTWGDVARAGNKDSRGKDRGGRRENRPSVDRRSGGNRNNAGSGIRNTQNALCNQVKDLKAQLDAANDSVRDARKSANDDRIAEEKLKKERSEKIRSEAMDRVLHGNGITFSQSYFDFSSSTLKIIILLLMISITVTHLIMLFQGVDNHHLIYDASKSYNSALMFDYGFWKYYVIRMCCLFGVYCALVKYNLRKFVSFGVRHRYVLSMRAPVVELPDMRPIGMSSGDCHYYDPKIIDVTHTRMLVLYFTSFPSEFWLLKNLVTKMFITSYEVLSEVVLPKNISISESSDTICSRLKYSAFALHGVNFNKYVATVSDGNIHDNAIVVGYGLYLNNCEVASDRPFMRDISK